MNHISNTGNAPAAPALISEALHTAMTTGGIVSLNNAAPACAGDDHAAQRLQTPAKPVSMDGYLR